MKKATVLFFALISILPLFGQEARMEVAGKPELSETEIAARRMPDGRFCASVKIFSDLENFSYDAYLGVQGLDRKPGQNILFLDPAERVLMVYHTGYEPLKLILAEIGVRLKERQVWEIRIRGGRVDVLPVSFLIEPANAEIFIDGDTMTGGPTFPLKMGRHLIKIARMDYRTFEDTIDVNLKQVLFRYSLTFWPEMVLIPGSTFEMGDVFGEEKHFKPINNLSLSDGNINNQVHIVTINNFYMSRYEVTFSEYDAFCEATVREKPGDKGWGRGIRPVIFVSWYDAVEFCNWLSGQDGFKLCYKIDKRNNPEIQREWLVECDFSANGYRLPTEAEWEYAAREGGKKVRFGNGKDIADPHEINFDATFTYKQRQPFYQEELLYRGKSVPVGSFTPNKLGLYDMSGNVWEWCWDRYDADYYQNSPNVNPYGPMVGRLGSVVRGGSWSNKPAYVRAAYRNDYHPDSRGTNCGFRLARTLPPKADR